MFRKTEGPNGTRGEKRTPRRARKNEGMKTKEIVTDPEQIDSILERGTIVDAIPTLKGFREKLLSGEKLRFYIGFDPTAPTLHLSHAKNFMLLEKFRKLGHEVIVLFGDFTAMIGDPTGEASTRKKLTKEEVKKNVSEWKKLVEPLMDFDDKVNPPKIMYNSEWLSALSMEDVIELGSNITVQRMLERDMFERRIKDKKPIFLHEFMYPLMQGYDSVAMDVDVEICGTDQTFNALVGRTLQKRARNKEKFIVSVTLMENPKTGELMSKSKGTGVFLDAAPNDLYGQVMAQPDEMIKSLFVNNTELDLDEIKKIVSGEPMQAKLKLAHEITKMLHGEDWADAAAEQFTKVVREKGTPEETETFFTSSDTVSLVQLLVDTGLCSSKGEAKRVISQSGIRLDGAQVDDVGKEVSVLSDSDILLQRGKRKFIRVRKQS